MVATDIKALIAAGEIRKGGQVIKVPITKIDGGTYDGQTYLIPLKYLYYNDQNGRIGSAISEYTALHGEMAPSNTEPYNRAIQSILEGDNASSKKAMKTLVRDMARKGQEIPGYVLNDGRVIDGNRRFTAHRLLDQDPAVNESQYFEAVLLDDLDAGRYDDTKRLKSLELKLQFGRLDRQDYDPIDRAIDVYTSIRVKKTMTNEAYARDAEMKKTDVDKMLYEAELIIKFLKYINADPNNYALAKQLSLDGPLQDLIPQYKKYIRNSANESEILGALFAKLLQLRLKSNNDADFKTSFRPIIKNVINSDMEANFIADMSDSVDTIVDTLGEKPIKTADDLMATISASQEAMNAIKDTQEITTSVVEESEDSLNRAQPEKLVGQAIKKLQSIDDDIFEQVSDDEKQSIKAELDTLTKLIGELNTKLG